jgi:hypothetical protein
MDVPVGARAESWTVMPIAMRVRTVTDAHASARRGMDVHASACVRSACQCMHGRRVKDVHDNACMCMTALGCGHADVNRASCVHVCAFMLSTMQPNAQGELERAQGNYTLKQTITPNLTLACSGSARNLTLCKLMPRSQICAETALGPQVTCAHTRTDRLTRPLNID